MSRNGKLVNGSPNHVEAGPGPNPVAVRAALLTGGDDRPYALGLGGALIQQGVHLDFIASDQLKSPDLESSPLINFLNLRGDQSRGASFIQKAKRITAYYLRLLRYAATAKPRIFHILWNNKYETIDRVCLMAYYRLLGKKMVFTAHNVNAAKRDGHDSLWNRFTLSFQYRLCHHLFVHTPRMRDQLRTEFAISADRISVIPFGINNTIPRSALTRFEARLQLGLGKDDKTLLFFGQIAPYKGLEHLVMALCLLADLGHDIKLVIAGKVKPGHESYWEGIEQMLRDSRLCGRVTQHVRFIRDNEVELYLKAADALALPYVSIFQSGVPFLAYSFGRPVIATNVGSLRDDIIEGKTGMVTEPENPAAIAKTVENFFASTMYRESDATAEYIVRHANERHSWTTVGALTRAVYEKLQ